MFGNNFQYKLISYRNQSIDRFANQLTGFNIDYERSGKHYEKITKVFFTV